MQQTGNSNLRTSPRIYWTRRTGSHTYGERRTCKSARARGASRTRGAPRRKERSMAQATGNGARRKIGGTLAIAIAVLLFAAAPFQLAAANPAHGGGSGGGFHAGGSGFHGGAFHRRFRAGVAVGVGGIYVPYLWYYGYPYYDYNGYYPDYGDSGYAQPDAGPVWYYCSDPAGYYPYVTQCNTGWQTVPAG